MQTSIASYEQRNTEKLAGDLLLGLKLEIISITFKYCLYDILLLVPEVFFLPKEGRGERGEPLVAGNANLTIML